MFKPDFTLEMNYISSYPVRFLVDVTGIEDAGIYGKYRFINPRHSESTMYGLFTWNDIAKIIDDCGDHQTNDDMNKWFVANQDELLTYLRRAWLKLMPSHMKDPWVAGMIEVVKDKHEPCIKLMMGTIEIHPSMIGRTSKKPGFSIKKMLNYQGDYCTPPDTDIVELGESLSPVVAARMAITELWNIMCTNLFDQLGEERMAKELCKDLSY